MNTYIKKTNKSADIKPLVNFYVGILIDKMGEKERAQEKFNQIKHNIFWNLAFKKMGERRLNKNARPKKRKEIY